MVILGVTPFGMGLFIGAFYDAPMLRRASLVLFALILAAPVARAQTAHVFMFETGKSLLAKCENKAPEYALACTAYIVGVVDGIKKDIYLGRARDNCWPDELGADRVRDIVVKYLKKYTDQRGSPASLVVSVALNDAYSCQK